MKVKLLSKDKHITDNEKFISLNFGNIVIEIKETKDYIDYGVADCLKIGRLYTIEIYS